MTNGKEQNLWNVEPFFAEIFGGEIFGGANGSVGRGKKGGVVRCAAGGRRCRRLTQSESRGWGC